MSGDSLRGPPLPCIQEEDPLTRLQPDDSAAMDYTMRGVSSTPLSTTLTAAPISPNPVDDCISPVLAPAASDLSLTRNVLGADETATSLMGKPSVTNSKSVAALLDSQHPGAWEPACLADSGPTPLSDAASTAPATTCGAMLEQSSTLQPVEDMSTATPASVTLVPVVQDYNPNLGDANSATPDGNGTTSITASTINSTMRASVAETTITFTTPAHIRPTYTDTSGVPSTTSQITLTAIMRSDTALTPQAVASPMLGEIPQVVTLPPQYISAAGRPGEMNGHSAEELPRVDAELVEAAKREREDRERQVQAERLQREAEQREQLEKRHAEVAEHRRLQQVAREEAYRAKNSALRGKMKRVVLENAAYCDEIAVLKVELATAMSERRELMKRMQAERAAREPPPPSQHKPTGAPRGRPRKRPLDGGATTTGPSTSGLSTMSQAPSGITPALQAYFLNKPTS